MEAHYIPKFCQQKRRNGYTKPRTDFSSSSLLRRHCEGTSKLEVLGSNDNYPSFSSTSTVRSCQAPLSVHEDMPFIVVQCHVSENEGKEVVSSDSVEEMMSTEIELHPEVLLDTSINRSRIEDKSRDTAALLYSPNKSTSQVTESSDVWATPGTIVWARTGREVWWPAEVLEGKSAAVATSDEGSDGHILVQYYGNHEITWVDPASDLSEFDECYEERSCNPMESFQDALEQALHRKQHFISCTQLDRSCDRLESSSPQDQSVAQSNKWVESSSSREEVVYIDRGRGKRKRKPKVHFDEVTLSNKSMKKMRRIRIMRFLGLTAPVGSPFSLTAHERNCEQVI